jgi:hypothetical protein
LFRQSILKSRRANNMSWFRSLFTKPNPKPAASSPPRSYRPSLEQLEAREVPSAAPSFTLQANGELIERDALGHYSVVDSNVKAFDPVITWSGGFSLFDLHRDNTLIERDTTGHWTALRFNVSSMEVFGNSAGHATVETITTDSGLWQYNADAHSWQHLDKTPVDWMHGVANSNGTLNKLFWLSHDGNLWELANNMEMLLRTNVKMVNVFSSQTGVTLVVLGKDNSLYAFDEGRRLWATLEKGGITWMQGVANSAGNVAKIYLLTTDGRLYLWLPGAKLTLLNQFVQSVTVDSQGNPHITYDPIGTFWNTIGRPAWLGSPVTWRLTTPGGQGVYAQFTYGIVIWTPQTGAHSISGTMYQDWLKTGGLYGPLGAPTSGQAVAQDGSGDSLSQIQTFKGGALFLVRGWKVVTYTGSAYAALLTVLGQLADPTIKAMTLNLVVEDSQMNRTAMVRILRQAAVDGSVSGAEFASLQKLISSASSLNTPDSVRVLASKVVNGNQANAHFQGQFLGNLHVGSSGTQLLDLIDKWFFGADHPVAIDDFGHRDTYRLAPGSPYGLVGRPQDTDVDQGLLGDCYLLASLGELAYRNPNVIGRMITDNHDALFSGDDTYTVRLWNPSANAWDYVTVDRWFPADSSGRFVFANLGKQVSNGTVPLWVALIEKAYAEASEEGWMNRPAINSYANIDAGWPYLALQNITGKPTSHTMLNGVTSLVQAWKVGTSIVLNSFISPASSQVISNHAYMLIGYDLTRGLFVLLSPWGPSGGTQNGHFKPGTLTLNATQLAQNFSSWDSELG